MIVLREADVDRAANMAVQWAMSNSGQICIAVERVYVEEPVYDEFVEKVVARTRELAPGRSGRAGHGRRRRDDVPAADRDRRATTCRTRSTRARRCWSGGKAADGPGHFFEPTVLTGVDHTMKIMTEETFGPTLPIMKVRDADEAVRLANDSRYGLNSSVFTKDVAKGEQVARRLNAGNACVNDALMNYLALEAPFGGANESGLGARHGAPGIRKYCATQTILVTRFGLEARADDVPEHRLQGEGVREADAPDVGPEATEAHSSRPGRNAGSGIRAAAVRADSNPAALRAARWLRSRLPGDDRFGTRCRRPGTPPWRSWVARCPRSSRPARAPRTSSGSGRCSCGRGCPRPRAEGAGPSR